MKWNFKNISMLLFVMVLVWLQTQFVLAQVSSGQGSSGQGSSGQSASSQDLVSELLEPSGNVRSPQIPPAPSLAKVSLSSDNIPQDQALTSELLEPSGAQQLPVSAPAPGPSPAPAPAPVTASVTIAAPVSVPATAPTPAQGAGLRNVPPSQDMSMQDSLLSDLLEPTVTAAPTAGAAGLGGATIIPPQALGQAPIQNLTSGAVSVPAPQPVTFATPNLSAAFPAVQPLVAQPVVPTTLVGSQVLQVGFAAPAQPQAAQPVAQFPVTQGIQAQPASAFTTPTAPTGYITPTSTATPSTTATPTSAATPTTTPSPTPLPPVQSQAQIQASLVAILGDVTQSGTPALLNANVVAATNNVFNQAYLQDYPNISNSIYTAIKNFYNNRSSSSNGDVQILLNNAQNKAFLTTSENSDVKNWLMLVRQDIQTALNTILGDPTQSGTPALLNANVVSPSATNMAAPFVTVSLNSLAVSLNASFNQSYLQNYPSSGNSIFTAIQNFYNNRQSYPLGDVQLLLSNAQNKAFLTSSQASSIQSWLGQIMNETKAALVKILSDKTQSGTPALLNANVVGVTSGWFNQSYLQDYPGVGSSIYTAIQNFYNNRTAATLTDLQTLLNNALNQSVLTFAENADITTWLTQVGVDLMTSTQSSSTLSNTLNNFTVTAANYNSQLAVLQALVTSVSANAQANPLVSYASVQPNFWSALTNLHNARPTTDPVRLQALKAWYATLATSPLVSSSSSFTSMNNDINSNLASITQSSVQSAEMARVKGILNNFTVTASTYDSQLAVLQTLVTSVNTNSQANPSLDYTSVQASFWKALTNLHNARPTTDSVKLQALLAWYVTLSTSKLISSTNNFTVMNSDINSNLASGAQESAEMARVNNILSNFTVTASTYDSQLAVLQTLVTSVNTNSQSNPSLDYTSAQASFWTALTNLYNARPRTDQVRLQALQAWYVTLSTSKLISTTASFTAMNKGINSDLAGIAQSALQLAEMTRVSNILNNFTVTASTYDSQLAVLQALVTSVNTNSQANPSWNYTPVQTSFWAALTNLQNARPTTDSVRLQALSAWYATLATSKLISSSASLATFNNAISSDLTNIALATPGGTSFTFNPSIMGTGAVAFSPQWTFNNGNALLFQAIGTKEIDVVFSATQDQTGNIYKLVIGRSGNNYTSLVGVSSYSVSLGADVQGVGVSSGVGSYWVQIIGNKLSFGTGSTAGSNVKGSWTIAPANQISPKYFGLGGLDAPVVYTNIRIR